jgi:hypothetical protein
LAVARGILSPTILIPQRLLFPFVSERREKDMEGRNHNDQSSIMTETKEDGPMLWYCAFTWYPNTSRQQVAQRIVQQHDAGANHPERIRGWYNLAGGGSGFLLVEVDQPQEVTAFLQPYMDLMSFDVRAVYPLKYEETIQEMRQAAQQEPQPIH